MKTLKFEFSSVKPWQRTLFIMFLAQFMVAVGFSSIFPFLPFYVEELGTNTKLSVEFLAGLVYSAQAFTMMISAPIWGTLADRFGRKIMVERAMFGGAVILFMMAFAQRAEHVVTLRAVQGLVTGTVAAANALVAAEVPRNRTGFAMGFLQVGFGTGLAIGPLIGGLVADAFSYSVAFFVTAALLFLAGVLVLIGVRENFIPMPEKSGEDIKFISKWKKIISAEGVVITYGMRFMSSLARMLIIPIIPLYISFLKVDPSRLNTFTGLVMGVASGATTLSSVYFGRLGDNIGHRKILIGCSLAAAFLYAPQSLVENGWQLLVFQIIVGIAIGGVIPTVSALLANYSQSGDEGAVYGLDNSINAAGRALAPLLGAWVATSFGLRATFPATGMIFLVSVLIALWLLPKDHPGLKYEIRTIE
jgi:DHA1 family multidrug resistance protein-like MFS transporter